MPNCYAIMINWSGDRLNEENIKKVDNAFSSIGDWLRFSGSGWLLITERTANDIYHLLAAFLVKTDNELIFKVDPGDYAGFAPKWINEWLETRVKPLSRR